MTSTADLFTQVAADAIALDCLHHPGPPQVTGPKAIAAAVLAVHDRLPGSAGTSETGVRAPRMEQCQDIDCPDGAFWDPDERRWEHSHPTPKDPTGDAAMRPSRSDADLERISHLVDRFVASIAELVSRSVSRGVPTTWDEAVSDCSMLDQMDAVTALCGPWGDKKVRKWVTNAGDALHDLERIWNEQRSREPDDHERSWTSGLADGECCRVCFKLGLRVGWQDGGAGGLCQGCYRLRNRCAAINDMTPEDVGDPPVELIEELRRIGAPGSPNDRNARSRWFQSVGTANRYCA